jgi:hypothetical protein
MSRAAKDYPLLIETLHDCDDHELVAYYSKGHHDPAAFVEAVMRDHGDEYPVEKVKHEQRRWQIVCGPDEWMRSLGTPRKGTTTRGVFPVTIIEW